MGRTRDTKLVDRSGEKPNLGQIEAKSQETAKVRRSERKRKQTERMKEFIENEKRRKTNHVRIRILEVDSDKEWLPYKKG